MKVFFLTFNLQTNKILGPVWFFHCDYLYKEPISFLDFLHKDSHQVYESFWLGLARHILPWLMHLDLLWLPYAGLTGMARGKLNEN